MPSNRASGCGCFAAELEFARQQPLYTFVIHEQHDEVDRLSASLEAKVATPDGDECRCTPAMGSPAGTHAAAVLSADDESTLRHVRNHGNTLGIIEHFFRNALIRCSHDFLED